MSDDTDPVRAAVRRAVDGAAATAVSAGIVRQRLDQEFDVDVSDIVVSDLLHEMVDDGELVYYCGEYGEFAMPADQPKRWRREIDGE